MKCLIDGKIVNLDKRHFKIKKVKGGAFNKFIRNFQNGIIKDMRAEIERISIKQ